MFRNRKALVDTLCLLTALALFSTTASLAESCEEASSITSNAAAYSSGGVVGEGRCYRLELVSPGWLHLNLITADWAEGRARFDLSAAGTDEKAKLQLVRRRLGERVAFLRPGTWWIQVRAEDPRHPLPPYQLESRFLEDTSGWVTKDEENEGELEPDPETLTTGAQAGPWQALCPSVANEKSTRKALDVGNSFTCAAAFHGDTTAVIDHAGWDGDVDVFRFQLLEWRTLALISNGEIETALELFNDAGQRLAISDLAGDSVTESRLVRTLAPGKYFVRVTGRSEGSYRLTADVGR